MESKTSDCGKLANDKTTPCGMVLKSGVVFVIQADGALVDDQKPSHAGIVGSIDEVQHVLLCHDGDGDTEFSFYLY